MLLTVYVHIYISGVTILLSLTVFMNMVSEIMPNTSDAVPLIGNSSKPVIVTVTL
jgi:nicotinic acetylcholine receptor alpha-7